MKSMLRVCGQAKINIRAKTTVIIRQISSKAASLLRLEEK
jgi:hypothetical protein